MKHFERHQPTNLSQIVFAEPYVKQDLMDYATGLTTNNILLYGEPGIGKTTIALSIANQRLGGDEPFVLNAKSGKKLDVGACRNQVNLSLLMGLTPIVIIDEVDRFSPSTQDEIACFADEMKGYDGMLVFTTNIIQKVDMALASRCSQYHIKCLTPVQALSTAKEILDAECIAYQSDDWLLQQLELAVPATSVAADWRRYGQILDRIIRHNPKANRKPPPKLKAI